MPILVVAVGRRLSYPLKLVGTKSHLFARWEGTKDTFNIECTSLGFNSHPDNYYLKWPKPVSVREVEDYCFLKSMTPKEELAFLCAARGHVHLDNLEFKEALEAYAWAYELHPACRLHHSSFLAAKERWLRWLQMRLGRPFPIMEVTYNARRFRHLPYEDEVHSYYLNGLSNWIEQQKVLKPREIVDAESAKMIAQLNERLRLRLA